MARTTSGRAKIATAKTPRTYHLHRERQRRRILDAASRLFDERGIDTTTLAEIISASGVRASTLYEYFSNKEDLVWAIFSQLIEHDKSVVIPALERQSTGLAKIITMLEYMASELANNRPRIRFMAQFDAMYARNWPVESLLTLLGQSPEGGLESFKAIIREGIADRSLRPDLDPDVTLHAVMNAVIGAQRRLASLGPKVEIEFGQPIDRLFRETIRIILLGLRAPDPPSKPAPSAAPRTPARPRKKTS